MAKISSDPKRIEEHVLRLLIPQEILENFELSQIIENDTELLFDLIEKDTCIPKALSGRIAVLNGYMNATTLQRSQKSRAAIWHNTWLTVSTNRFVQSANPSPGKVR